MSKLKEISDLVSGLSDDHFAELQGAVAERTRASRAFSLDKIKVGMSSEDRSAAWAAVRQALVDPQNGR